MSPIVEAGDSFSGASVESIAEDAVRLRILCQTPSVTDARLEAALAHERRRDLRPPMPAEDGAGAGLAPRDAQRPSLALCHQKPRGGEAGTLPRPARASLRAFLAASLSEPCFQGWRSGQYSVGNRTGVGAETLAGPAASVITHSVRCCEELVGFPDFTVGVGGLPAGVAALAVDETVCTARVVERPACLKTPPLGATLPTSAHGRCA